MIRWQFYPRSLRADFLTLKVVDAFHQAFDSINSANRSLSSDVVLSKVAPHLAKLGFRVEVGKKKLHKVSVPVLFGRSGHIDKSFDADAHHEAEGYVVEVEAGRAVVNNQFLKDLFQACMMTEVRTLAIAVRNTYRGSNDFERICLFFDTLYSSRRLTLPLQGILIIGY